MFTEWVVFCKEMYIPCQSCIEPILNLNSTCSVTSSVHSNNRFNPNVKLIKWNRRADRQIKVVQQGI